MDNKMIIEEIVKKHNLMRIATIGLDGFPRVRGVDYVTGEDASELFFITHRITNKVQEIENNPNIAVVVDYDCDSMEELAQLKYIKGTGKASILKTPDEIQKVFGLILQKFPYLKDLPGDPMDFVGIRVKLDKISLTDNTVGFGHTVEVNY